MSAETMLLESAGGVFWATLIAFLIIFIVGAFIYMMKKLLDQNAAFNAQIIERMDGIVDGMKAYKDETCNLLDRHDAQAKEILKVQNETNITLKNRPCIK